MIIIRPNHKQAYLTFYANGTVNINKRIIGIWTRTSPKWGLCSPEKPRATYTARVCLYKGGMTQFTADSKLKLMRKVCANIPDSMLIKETQES